MLRKQYVDVEERHTVIQVGPDANDVQVRIEPVVMTWVHDDESVSQFEIEKVLDISRIASPAGGIGDRYTVKIFGHERYLWRERRTEAWFVETRDHKK